MRRSVLRYAKARLAKHSQQRPRGTNVRLVRDAALEVRQEARVLARRAPDDGGVACGAHFRHTKRKAWSLAEGPANFVHAGSSRRWPEPGPSAASSEHVAEDRRVNEVDVHDVLGGREVLAKREVDTLAGPGRHTVKLERELRLSGGWERERHQCDETHDPA